MITRITEIRDVGRLKCFRPDKAGEFDFGKNTVIFAPNATGKTTLAAVLKSYGTDNPSLLNCRGTLSSRERPFVLLQLNDEPRRFQNGAWHDRQESECAVIVFDHAFIEENVFSNAGRQTNGDIPRIGPQPGGDVMAYLLDANTSCRPTKCCVGNVRGLYWPERRNASEQI